MNMLPPGRPGVSSCSISAFTRAARAGLSERIMTLFERGSATRVTRCCASPGWPPLRRRLGAEQPIDQRHQVERRRVLQRHDDRLARRRLIERRDDLLDPPQVLGVVGDDQRIGAGKGGDRVVRRDQRPQHVQDLLRRLVAQRDDLRDQAVAAGADRAARRHRSRAASLRSRAPAWSRRCPRPPRRLAAAARTGASDRPGSSAPAAPK